MGSLNINWRQVGHIALGVCAGIMLYQAAILVINLTRNFLAALPL